MPDPLCMKRLLMAGAGLVVLVLAALSGSSILERNRTAAEWRALRAALEQARFSADSCRNALGYEERAFRRFDQAVDSLRSVTESFEDPAKGGVPQPQYEAYMESFERYNDSVDVWQTRADSLRASEGRCRSLVEAHNALGDSIRKRQEEMRAGKS